MEEKLHSNRPLAYCIYVEWYFRPGFFPVLLHLQTFSPRLEFAQTQLEINILSNLQSLNHFNMKTASFFTHVEAISYTNKRYAIFIHK